MNLWLNFTSSIEGRNQGQESLVQRLSQTLIILFR